MQPLPNKEGAGPSSFLRQLEEDYNRLTGQPAGAAIDRPRLSAWLDSRSEADGLSVLERQVLSHRQDVRESVLEGGAPDVFRLDLWVITYGAHELGLDNDILAGTITEVLSLGKGDRGTMKQAKNAAPAAKRAGRAVRTAGRSTRKHQAA